MVCEKRLAKPVLRAQSRICERRNMKSIHSEDLEFLRKIRGSFASIGIWPIKYEFTGEKIIERHGKRIKNQIRISDVIETKVLINPHRMVIKTNNSEMTVRVIPCLNAVIQNEAAKVAATESKAERQHFEEVKQQTISRVKRANLIGMVIVLLLIFALIFFVAWLKQKH
jgi:hypothetical protein